MVKSVHKSLIYIRRRFESDRIKIEATRKQKKKNVFFSGKTDLFLSQKPTKKPCFWGVFALWPLKFLSDHSQSFGECRLDFCEHSWWKKNCPQNIFFIAIKKVRFHQRKVIGQGSKFLFEMCSSHQDCYVHQFSDDSVDVRYRLYRSEKNSGIALAPCIIYVFLFLNKLGRKNWKENLIRVIWKDKKTPIYYQYVLCIQNFTFALHLYKVTEKTWASNVH